MSSRSGRRPADPSGSVRDRRGRSSVFSPGRRQSASSCQYGTPVVGHPRRSAHRHGVVERTPDLSSADDRRGRSPPPLPIRLTTLTDCGGCAAKLGADLLADALSGLGAPRPEPAELLAGLEPARRRRRLPDQRRARDHRHARLLPAARRRPADVRRDRGGERAVRRVRDGRPRPVRPVDRGVPRGPAAGHAGRDLRRRRGQGPRGGRHPRRRPHDPRPGAEVRAGGHRRRPSGPAPAQGRRPARRQAPAHEAARDRPARQRPPPGPDRSDGRDLAAAIDQMRTLNRAASEVLVANGVARPRPT